MEQGLARSNNRIVAAVECCHNQSDPCSLLSSWINLVMLQLTSCLQEEGLLTVIVFRSLWLVKLLKENLYTGISVVQCMQGEYIFDDCCYYICTSFGSFTRF